MLKRFLALLLALLVLQAFCAPALTQNLSSQQTSAQPVDRNLLRPLWPGSRWTEGMRARAVRRGLQFIYRTALVEKNFKEYGSDYLWCFYTMSEALSDAQARALARRMGLERARRWRQLHRSLPRDADAGTIADYAFGSDAADSLGLRDDKLKDEIRSRAPRFNARAYLLFDPLTEPPPSDVPDECDFCGEDNPRGASVCGNCKRPLRMRTRQDVWYDALITTYSGEHYGVLLGAKYADVLKWLPTLRPYRDDDRTSDEFYDTVYAITHVVYTLNDYSLYRLDTRLLPQEFKFLRDNMTVAVKQRDADMLGEFMDTLRAFGLTTADPLMRQGMEYLLAHQNRDGSWGNRRERDIYLRYHPTWNAVAALSEYAWRGERLSHPELKSMLEEWAAESR
ncbi:MAG: hypothetical protein ICV60_18860 [Pyrinomonadaceae bacterium]|nr:hypothetical protein [Pyrinomonadaceae bacterium]